MRHLVALEDVGFAQRLHRVQMIRGVDFADQRHLAECPDTDGLDLDEHALVHFGALEAYVVALLLVKHFTHLDLRRFRQAHIVHLLLQLILAEGALSIGLDYILDMLFHEELESLRRILTYAKLFALLLLLLGDLLAFRDGRGVLNLLAGGG